MVTAMHGSIISLSTLAELYYPNAATIYCNVIRIKKLANFY